MTQDPPAARGNGLTYAEAGVSIEAGNALVERIKPLAAATRRPGVLGGLGGFAGLFDLAATGRRDPLLVAATDGVGTKLKLAIDWGAPEGLDGLGRDLVAMCVNDLLCQGAEPLLFLDYFATGRLDPEHAARVVAGVAAGCLDAGCALLGGETAEMPGLYRDGDFDLAGFAVGVVERTELLPRAVRPGDRLIGVASSGPHSNGYSLIRRILEARGHRLDAPAPFAPDRPLAAALLEPTRIYVRAVLALLDDVELGPKVRGLAHITGGGLIENPPRALAASEDAADLGLVLEFGRWTPPPVFGWLAAEGGVARDEMLRTFNCGLGLVLMVDPSAAAGVVGALERSGERAWDIGAVERRAGAAGAVVVAGATPW